MSKNSINIKKLKKQTLIFFALVSIVVVASIGCTRYNVSAQTGEPSITEIGDRYVVVNWTLPTSLMYNSFRIDYYDEALNQSFTWSMILLNDTQSTTLEYFTQVNYTIDQEVFLSQKLLTMNFTAFLIEDNAETVQAKITGLKPESHYIISIYLVNTSLVILENNYVVITDSSALFWESDQFETLLSLEDSLKYSKLATSLTLLVIIILFIAIFFFIAKRDVPFNKIAYVFIFPALLALVLLEVYPILYGIFLSFTDYHLKRGEIPVLSGFNNYAHIAENPQLPITLTTTLVWSTLIIIAKIVLGFLLAYVIQYKVKKKKLWYLMLYIPWAIPSYIKILSWRTFIHGNGGNSLFNTLFGTNVNLLTQPYVTLFLACFVEVWDSIPLITTLFLGGLSSIPKELNDIADIDQISERTKIRRVILPLIKPIILPAIILEIIKTFGSFNVAFLLTKGYPLLSYGTSEVGVIGATDLFSTFTFYMFYEKRDIGIAAAYSTIMSILTLFFVLVWLKMSKGTQSSFKPEKKTDMSKSGHTIIALLFIQAIFYIVSGIFGFRYFGIFWNPYLNYLLAGLFLLSGILSLVRKRAVLKTTKYLLILDLILSLIQFAFYQMWYAFNWNIFIVITQLYLLTNIQWTKLPQIFPNILEKIKMNYQTSVNKFKEALYWIDNHLIQLSPTHSIIALQTIFVFLSAFIIKTHSWLAWSIFGTYVIVLIFSLFSKLISYLSIILQPLLWFGMIFAEYPIGWIIILNIISLAHILIVLNKFVGQSKLQSEKMQKVIAYIVKPRNNTLFLFSILLITLLPIWNIVWIAFSQGDSLVPTSFFPANPTLENFKLLFTQEQIQLNFLNSLIVSLGSATLCVILTALAAYAFSRYYFRGKNEIMVGVFTLKMFTGILTLIPFYLIMYNLGLIDSYFGIILAYSTHTIPLAIWITKGYIDSIPKELDESATLMGNSKFRILRKIILPLAGPAIAITFLLNFLRTWNGFLLAFVLLQSPNKYTLPIKLFTFVGSIESSSPEWGLFAAASILVVIPLLIIFVFLRNHLLSGFNSSTTMREI